MPLYHNVYCCILTLPMQPSESSVNEDSQCVITHNNAVINAVVLSYQCTEQERDCY